MPCYHPISAYQCSRTGTVAFQELPDSRLLSLPCGRCIGCRLERSRQWAQRIMDEARDHDRNSFLTLTYAPEHLPKTGSLDKRHFQLFMKKLRKALHPRKIRFFHSGEYGEKFARPHYHACIFGEDFFEGRYDVEKTPRGDTTWSSPIVERAWGKGMHQVGALTFESAAYVARYITKKVTGQRAEDHYWRYNHVTGECWELLPEYATMSRGGRSGKGIGYSHASGYAKEILARDGVICRGRVAKPPRFYDKYFAVEFPAEFEDLKASREFARTQAERRPLSIKETIKLAQIKTFLTRRYEIG